MQGASQGCWISGVLAGGTKGGTKGEDTVGRKGRRENPDVKVIQMVVSPRAGHETGRLTMDNRSIGSPSDGSWGTGAMKAGATAGSPLGAVLAAGRIPG